MFRHTIVALCALVVIACGDGGSGNEQADARTAGPDGAPPCVLPLELGHCIDGATGEPCIDFNAADRQFIPLEANQVVRPIVGPQGSDMFVFGIRAANVDPGTDTDPPMVELAVYDGTQEQGGFLSWPVFTAVSGMQVAPQLFTVIADSAALEGKTLRLTGQIIDPSDNRFCGEATFTAGALIVPTGI